ncbi:MAG: aminotransferase class I/II-fold pyridoxal phosphate-dependent enzyme [Alphaproteobacteria bacterium]|nr:aminotransferase class I/II-fold pyridoxal phosphate-dependent enzyme [Alphaproteobacteria bacterium]
MTHDFSRRKFLRNSLIAAGAAGAAVQAGGPAFAKEVVKAKATETTPKIINLGANTLSIGPAAPALTAIAAYAPISGGYEPTNTHEIVETLSSQLGAPADHFMMYPGSGTPLDLVVMAFTGPKGSLVTADPTYEQAWRTSQRSGAKLIKVPQRKDYSHDVEAMCAADTSTGMMYICNPNNPTGAITMRKDIEYAVKNMPKGCTLVVDEAYIHFSDNATSAIDLVAAGENVVVLRTFSKLYGMAGLRLGFAVASPANLAKMNGGSGRSQGIIAATTIGAGVASLKDPQLIATRKAMIKKQRTETIAWLEKKGHACSKSEANHFMVDVKRPGKDFQKDMATWGVNVGRTWVGYENWSRVSVGTEAEMTRFRDAFVAVAAGKLGPVEPMERRRRASLETRGATLQHASFFQDEQVDLMPLSHC